MLLPDTECFALLKFGTINQTQWIGLIKVLAQRAWQMYVQTLHLL